MYVCNIYDVKNAFICFEYIFERYSHQLSLPLQDELAEDLKWSQSRPAVIRARAVEGNAGDGNSNAWELALSDFERKSLAAYRSNWPGMAFSLTQNGASGFAMHSSPDSLHTLIRNLGFVWSDILASGGKGRGLVLWSSANGAMA